VGVDEDVAVSTVVLFAIVNEETPMTRSVQVAFA
jgi:hypothetical protein